MINLLVPVAFCAEGGLLDSGLCVRLFTLAGNVYSSGRLDAWDVKRGCRVLIFVFFYCFFLYNNSAR